MRDDVVKFRYPRYPAFLWTLGIAATAMLIGSLTLKSWRAFAAILLGLSIRCRPCCIGRAGAMGISLYTFGVRNQGLGSTDVARKYCGMGVGSRSAPRCLWRRSMLPYYQYRPQRLVLRARGDSSTPEVPTRSHSVRRAFAPSCSSD